MQAFCTLSYLDFHGILETVTMQAFCTLSYLDFQGILQSQCRLFIHFLPGFSRNSEDASASWLVPLTLSGSHLSNETKQMDMQIP